MVIHIFLLQRYFICNSNFFENVIFNHVLQLDYTLLVIFKVIANDCILYDFTNSLHSLRSHSHFDFSLHLFYHNFENHSKNWILK
jgi:hypothetical protein